MGPTNPTINWREASSFFEWLMYQPCKVEFGAKYRVQNVIYPRESKLLAQESLAN